jgi:hypothetical protein
MVKYTIKKNILKNEIFYTRKHETSLYNSTHMVQEKAKPKHNNRI